MPTQLVESCYVLSPVSDHQKLLLTKMPKLTQKSAQANRLKFVYRHTEREKKTPNLTTHIII